MLDKKLKNIVHGKKLSLLGVGPMSKNCVDVSVEIADQYQIPLMLIASRRQIDSEEFGGGYVNNWSTSEYAGYINKIKKTDNILLARDHGGPWQNEQEKNMSLDQAMRSAKNSYMADIDAGFHILHIDPSIDPRSCPTKSQILDRIFELYEFCWEYAQSKNSEIIFEIGTEEQSGGTNTYEELQDTLGKMREFTTKNRLPFPTFVVVQTGTKVMETTNIGSFESPIRVENELPCEIQIPKILEICNQNDILMKEHNADYLTDDSLKWHPRLGIHAVNVAPEFGVAETKAILNILQQNKMNQLIDNFYNCAFDSLKWKKWMLPNTKKEKKEKSIIAGHYIFSSKAFLDIKKAMYQKLGKEIVENELRKQVKESILRYVKNFRLI